MLKMCQSCGVPLKQGKADIRGTQTDGTRSDIYCNRCYLNGKFQEPHITAQDIIDRGLKQMKESKSNRFSKWIFSKTYAKNVNNLKRWTNK